MPELPPALATLCDDIHHDRFGGSAEMVEAAAAAFAAAARKSTAPDPAALAAEVERGVDAVLEVMPSIAPMTNLLHRVMAEAERLAEPGVEISAARERVALAAEVYLERQAAALGAIARLGAELIHDGDRVGTYSTSGTVWRIFQEARRQGKRLDLVVTESRPGNEGLRTMRDTAALGIPVTLSIDAALGPLYRGCALLVIGADVITSTGDVLAKVGSYLAALVAREYGIPFFVAADTSKFDPMTLQGLPLKIHDQGPAVVAPGTAPASARVICPTFEIIPARLVTGLLTEEGLLSPGSVAAWMHAAALSQRLSAKLQAWAHAGAKS